MFEESRPLYACSLHACANVIMCMYVYAYIYVRACAIIFHARRLEVILMSKEELSIGLICKICHFMTMYNLYCWVKLLTCRNSNFKMVGSTGRLHGYAAGEAEGKLQRPR